MKRRLAQWISVLLFAAAALTLTVEPVFGHAQHGTCSEEEFLCSLIENETSVAGVIDEATMPKLTDPSWTKPVVTPSQHKIVVPYQVTTRGAVDSSLESFATMVAQTYADARGWSQLGVTFKRVQSGGSFTVILTQASLMTTFSATGCDTTYSCNVGNDVVINNDRWQYATGAWNNGGGSLRDYRHMVINHETGHWLGHGHQACGGARQAAPVMQQQSINLQGCRFNPWPIANELYSPRLGI